MLFYKRFLGNYYPKYEYEAPDNSYCDPPTNCNTNLQKYNGWTTNSTYIFSSSLYYQCGLNKVFGGIIFGGRDLIKKVFNYVPFHDQVEVNFDFWKVDSWDNEIFTFQIDGITCFSQTFAGEGTPICGAIGYNDKVLPISCTIPHNSSSLTLSFQSNLDQAPADESYSIQNLKVYLIKSCDPSCMTCNSSNPSICTNCPFFAALNPTTQHCECKARFYMELSDITQCVECDMSCLTCDGYGPTKCTSCFFGDSLQDGTCASPPSCSLYLNFLIY